MEMSRFEAIDGDSIVTTVDVNCKVFISLFDDSVRSIIWVYGQHHENMGNSR